MDNQLPKYTSVLGSWADISNRAKELSTTDWQEEVYGRTGHVFSQNINISGGSENYVSHSDIAIMMKKLFYIVQNINETISASK